MMVNEIRFAGIRNARELGGIHIGDRQIKKGRLVRCAALTEITPEDISLLQKEYRLSYVVDFRNSKERRSQPDPEIPGAENRFLPVMELDDAPELDEETPSDYIKTEDGHIKMLLKAAALGYLGEDLYIGFLSSDRGKSAYREFFQILLDLPEDRGLLWHCTSGKDRTGVAAMLILSALGASRETIMEEYLLTNKQNEAKLLDVEKTMSRMGLSAEQKEIALFGMGGAHEKFMRAALDWMDEKYGGAVGYLKAELMIDAAAGDRLKHKLLY